MSSGSLSRLRTRASGLLLSRGSLVALSTVSKMVTRAGIFIIIAPILGPTNQGMLVMLSSYAAVIGLIVAYGFQTKALRDLALAPQAAHGILRGDLTAMAVLCLPAILVAGLVGAFWVTASWLVYGLIFAAVIATIVTDYLAAALRALDCYRTETGVSAASALLQFALVVPAGLLHQGLLPVALAMLVARALALALALFALLSRPVVRDSLERAASPVIGTLRRGWSYCVDASLSVAASQADILILSALATAATVGIYSAGARLVILVMSYAWITINVMVPKIVRQSEETARAREETALARIMALGSLSGMAILLIGGPFFVTHVLGEAFMPLNDLWPAFAILFICRSYESYFAILMLAGGRMSERAAAQTVALGATVLFGVSGAWAFGAQGMILALSAVAFGKGIWFSTRLAHGHRPTYALAMALAATVLIGGVRP
ncbi:lipopolysaccharide biosynthesis protein [Amaricoccus solimangrovi]|uniref:lipopolysaccharide biosynthesis protein n=1 Tax=Amaricoccus solimangrovi TaxID=2589815 RepID=UPI0015E37775|nr:hypothetical protein [Amaricoccus solimangrovi]